MALTYGPPIPTTGPRPTNIPMGYIAMDPSTGQLKMYDGSKWVTVAANVPEIMNKQLITEELTFGGMTFYIVEPKGYDWDKVYVWSRETFGPPRTDRDGHLNKWFISGARFHFHEEKHRDWFMIKWSSE